MVDDATLIARWDGRLPRYTSYPTAVQFHAGVDEARVRAWLAALPAEAPLSLYLHVPFCRRLCWYCGCHMVVVNRAAPVEAYVDDLIEEIALWRAALGARHRVTRIHWGGGTPSILGTAQWRRVDAALRTAFALEPSAEIAVELDPRTLSHAMVRTLAETGVSRVSLGVQDFDPAVQKAVNRIQPFEMVAELVARLRGARIERINLDLMYGLPHQTEISVARTARQALALNPDRVALFGYAHVPWMKRHQRLIDAAALPGAVERLAQFRAALAVFLAAGHVAIGLDHAARPDDPLAVAQAEGRLRRTFQGYTDDTAPVLIGLGASAISALPQGYAQNEAAVPQWRAAIRAGRLAIARGVEPDAEDRLRAALIERLMCDLALDIGATCRAHGASPDRFADAVARLDAMAADGLLARDGWRIAVSPRGRPFLRAIAAVFDRHLDPQAERHARAV
ncbi:oxygen-independent coproporphyrinogen III oxidase [Elioraea sp. Yellowstone]|jgi:oxygen-independent coproporphyrinogen-3 oxidase|uniref:oxygen-independent coproporphyrinogen III oxidase n=1 Tax=Elioraea sp. Yellowstone TaxID=2592070 RepID=UPI00114F4A62|nr:oxygen-independent coproporphyrinogen III oxidase [Elioraea sp. Yellowstone]TQF78488.1 oxygen-independent coproporphyrinogen III oxidase [Elioraea sp. Yellowstone]